MSGLVKLSFRRDRFAHGLVVALTVMVLAACGGPDLGNPSEHTPIPSSTPTIARPTAAVGRTTGAPCESGTLRIKDLPEIQKRWQAGLSVARGRAAAWKEDAVLIELGISCELFESGFRWQATFFSREPRRITARTRLRSFRSIRIRRRSSRSRTARSISTVSTPC